ncbi:nuclear transport factor 2 family protein [Ktedonospora formicarum]|uniref:Polyketide cyclase n=1 Tax=Ktedonospora formicarum TaxID=2778364 RepID=A0A8J3MVY9_9CHLR|nr:nuclear transport factor 2 family protein [Ktedonospora formicarum]GHO48431.1 polyketide cyclase [Ktedonospora formicarum]
MNQHNIQVVERLWKLIDTFQFEDMAPLLHDDFICEWPQSKERIRGRDNFIALCKHYPGQWRVASLKVTAASEQVISEVMMQYQEQRIYAVSFFEFRADQIVRQWEYWADTYPAPEWRAQWVEAMEEEA